MSYDRRGGGRRRYRDDYDDRRREYHETPEEKLRLSIIKFGEVDALAELPRVEKQIREYVPLNISNLSEAFRFSVTEQPYKIPYYASLLRALHEQPDASDGPSLGRQILEDLWKGFQSYLDKLAWREARLCIQFFAHLTMAKVVSPDSMISLLQAFTSVLDEFGVSNGRAKRAAMCAAEGLMFAGPVIKAHSALAVTDIINAIQAYNDTMSNPTWLVQPTTEAHQESIVFDFADELLDTILRALRTLNESDFSEIASIIPQPYASYPEPDSSFSPFNLPAVLVPPEVIEIDGLSVDSETDIQVRKEEWPEFYVRLFDNEITPDPTTPTGYVIRTALLDIVEIYEVNRKECARLLLEYPKWNLPGAFKPKPGAPVESDPVEGKDWQLESTILETILGAYLVLPAPSGEPLYYSSLITELCKLSPSTVGPAVGKSIRKLYGFLSEGLDVESARKFAEWFAIHMSNFNFQWVWREWIPDLSSPVQHPKRTFIQRAVEYEVRLSYHDRILKTLPEAMQAPDAYLITERAPGPNFEYDDPSNPYHESAQTVLNLIRGRAKAEDVIANLETLKTTLENADEPINVNSVVRSITVGSLLHIGSRSFSHLLNAIERYLPLLRSISSASLSTSGGGGSPEAKADILTGVASFWQTNRQMIGIVFDKLMQYQIVDPTDVVAWVFSQETSIGEPRVLGGPSSIGTHEWDLLKGALDKANGRVVIAKRKVVALRKEDDDTRGRAKATANAMEVDADKPGKGHNKMTENAQLTMTCRRRVTYSGQSTVEHCPEGPFHVDSGTKGRVGAHPGGIRSLSRTLTH
ncbi:MIF4G like domain containing protein [Amanita muscaria]